MAEPHFVEDYTKLVHGLMATHPLEEAMSRAVGGAYEAIGAIERAIVRHAGLRDGMSLVDLGCGSGRLASKLGEAIHANYTGIDIVPELLDYAKSKAPADYRFMLNRTLNLPLPTGSADMVCAFSLFTHLHQAETFLYLEDARRVLHPGGKVVFSFLEFAEPSHWPVFVGTLGAYRTNSVPHLNQFIERSQIDIWCTHLTFEREVFIGASEAPWKDEPPLGQAIAILRKP